MESKLGVLGIAGKLVKDVVHLWRQNFEKINFLSFYRLSKQQTTTFGFHGILGVNRVMLEGFGTKLIGMSYKT
jgi:hypothetical protein